MLRLVEDMVLRIIVMVVFGAGAYYYYNTEYNKSYEQTMLDAKAYADQAKIPYRLYLNFN